MKKDDVTVVMYKILNYLYTCMKQGEEAEVKTVYRRSGLTIDRYYYVQVMNYLEEKEFVKFTSKQKYEITVKGMLWCDGKTY